MTVKGRFGTLLYNCSTDHYITNAMARKHKFVGEEVELLVEGIGGETTKVESKIYQVPIKEKSGEVHFIECYGMDVSKWVLSPQNTQFLRFQAIQ